MATKTANYVLATDSQRKYVRDLRDGRQLPESVVAFYNDDFIDAKMTKVQASRAIDGMRGYDPKPREQREDVTVASLAAPVTEEGLYEAEGTVYQVRRSGRGYLYAKEFTGDGFVYVGTAPLKTLTANDTLTVARAEELSLAWGRCIRCHKVLTAQESVAKSIGPVCIKYFAA